MSDQAPADPPPAAAPYTHLASWYDAVYAARGKDYRAEAAWILERWPHARTLLDVGCGTGEHLRHFRSRVDVAGLDAHSGMLDVARRKLPDVPFTHASMTHFDLGRTFDLVTCLFAAAAYLPDAAALDAALERLAAHVAPGGAVLVEPSVLPDEVTPPQVQHDAFTDADGAVTRTTTARLDGARLIVTFRFERAGHADPRHETHLFTLFSRATYERAFHRAGLTVHFERPGPAGRGLFIGARPA